MCLWISIGSVVVELGGDLWCRVGAGGAQIWFRFGTVVVCSCVCGLSLCGPELVQLWFRFVWPHGSQVQVRF